jgi:hypothetical protein
MALMRSANFFILHIKLTSMGGDAHATFYIAEFYEPGAGGKR